MTHETAGDPVSGLKWTRRTTAKIAAELGAFGIDVCARTVARLLKAVGFSLRVNHKKLAGTSHPNRDDQFQRITALRERCTAESTPVISVDTKKKELVGAFKNAGAKWDRAPELVKDHDFPSEAEGRAIPYGIYDPLANTGTVFVGATADTPAFAVDCIEKWWRTEGRKRYPRAEALQILADSGGSNGCRPRAWKFNLQHRLCNRHGLRVTVAHYPTAASKWNPIEHMPNGHVVVIDLGCSAEFSPLEWLGRPTIDSLVVTHPHGDHIDEILALRPAGSVCQFWRPTWLTEAEIRGANQTVYDDHVNRYLEMSARYTRPLRNDELVGNPDVSGGVRITHHASRECGRSNINNHSQVVVFEYRGLNVVIRLS